MQQQMHRQCYVQTYQFRCARMQDMGSGAEPGSLLGNGAQGVDFLGLRGLVPPPAPSHPTGTGLTPMSLCRNPSQAQGVSSPHRGVTTYLSSTCNWGDFTVRISKCEWSLIWRLSSPLLSTHSPSHRSARSPPLPSKIPLWASAQRRTIVFQALRIYFTCQPYRCEQNTTDRYNFQASSLDRIGIRWWLGFVLHTVGDGGRHCGSTWGKADFIRLYLQIIEFK